MGSDIFKTWSSALMSDSSLSDVSLHVVVNRLVKHCQEEICIFHCDAHGGFDPEGLGGVDRGGGLWDIRNQKRLTPETMLLIRQIYMNRNIHVQVLALLLFQLQTEVTCP